jgi:hypothetical protein
MLFHFSYNRGTQAIRRFDVARLLVKSKDGNVLEQGVYIGFDRDATTNCGEHERYVRRNYSAGCSTRLRLKMVMWYAT